MKQILIIDDELLSRESIKNSIQWEYYGYRICGEAANGADGLLQIRRHQPDVIFLDIKMPVMDGLTLLHNLQSEKLDCKVIMLSVYDDFEYVREAMRLGAVDYLLKHTFEDEDLIHLLQKLDQLFLKETTVKKGLSSLRQDILLQMASGRTGEEDFGALVETGLFPSDSSCYLVASLRITEKKDITLVSLLEEIDLQIKQYQKELSDSFHTVYFISESQFAASILFLFSPDRSAAFQKNCVREYLGFLYSELQKYEIGWLTGVSYRSYSSWAYLHKACLESKELLGDELPYSDCSPKILSAIDYMKSHYSHPISLEEIAESIGISRIYLSQIFKKETGMTINEYLGNYRLQKAKELLLTSNLKIYTIAEMCGFGSVQYFSQVFKKVTGFSPYQFKDTNANIL